MPRGRPPKYPWDEWTDGTSRILRQSEDWERGSLTTFPANVKVASFRAECHAAARRKGGKADTKIAGNAVRFRYIEDDA
jgi:hypothetical protein